MFLSDSGEFIYINQKDSIFQIGNSNFTTHESYIEEFSKLLTHKFVEKPVCISKIDVEDKHTVVYSATFYGAIEPHHIDLFAEIPHGSVESRHGRYLRRQFDNKVEVQLFDGTMLSPSSFLANFVFPLKLSLADEDDLSTSSDMDSEQDFYVDIDSYGSETTEDMNASDFDNDWLTDEEDDTSIAFTT